MTPEVLFFSVPGKPAPQGSKNPFGGEANPRTKPWRGAVSAEASQAMGDRDLFTGAVRVYVKFSFTRPKSHFRTGRNSHLLRDDAPQFQTTHPDLDKLQRAIGDALTGVALRDDKQIASWQTVKVYGDRAFASVWITALSREENDVAPYPMSDPDRAPSPDTAGVSG